MKNEIRKLRDHYENKIEERKKLIDFFDERGCKENKKIVQTEIRGYMEVIDDLNYLMTK